MENLDGKVAFVTGGASGIGLGITKAMVAAGMRVVMADVRQDHLDEARATLHRLGRSHERASGCQGRARDAQPHESCPAHLHGRGALTR